MKMDFKPANTLQSPRSETIVRLHTVEDQGFDSSSTSASILDVGVLEAHYGQIGLTGVFLLFFLSCVSSFLAAD